MDRKRLEREELDGKLIAYLDGELSAAECEELEARLACDSDLGSALDDYRHISECLEELCAAGTSVTPAHILARFRVDVPIPGKPALGFEKGEGLSPADVIASNDFTKPATPTIQNDLPIAANQNHGALTDLAARRAAKGTDAIKKIRSYRFQSISQMAAALVLGVFIGPQFFNGMDELHNAERAELVQLRSADKVAASDAGSANKPVTVLSMSEKRVFEKIVTPEDFIEKNAPFVVEINAPLDGIVRIYAGVDFQSTKLRTKETMNFVHESSVKVGDRLLLPKTGAFIVNDHDRFTLIVVFEGKGEKHETFLEYHVE